MDLSELKRGERAMVRKVELPDAVKARLRALGIYSGASLSVLKISPFKRTYLVQAGPSKVAIGRETARGVQICKL